MSVFLWIIFGALVGWLASMLMPTEANHGIFLNIILGIIGAVVGGWLMSLTGKSGVSGFNIYSFLVALLGACVFIALIRTIRWLYQSYH